MILSITTTHQPATDLGYLLHKHPDRLQSIDLAFGKAHIFYPEKDENRTTISMVLDIDPIEMVRGSKRLGGDNFALGLYVNDRPYVASSFMSTAISKAFSSALNGKCKDRPELVNIPLPFEVTISAIQASQGGEFLIRSLFEPLGYELKIIPQQLDVKFPEWGNSNYFTLKLKNKITTQELLSHLYVLIPTLDQNKHYFITEDEIDKLLKNGRTWLKEHPQKEVIISRYLINLSSLARQALGRVNNVNIVEADPNEEARKRIYKESLHDKRLKLVADKLIEGGAKRVLDLGCGDGKLLSILIKHKQFTEIVGMDVSYTELMKAKERLHLASMPPQQQERIQLFQGSLTYKDQRLTSFDAAAVVEVIEHLDLNRLKTFERVLFEFAKPKTVIITTPNQEYNQTWKKLDADTMRHSDHRFEWTRKEFATWANQVADKYNYTTEFFAIGDEVENIGAPSQLAVFTYGD